MSNLSEFFKIDAKNNRIEYFNEHWYPIPNEDQPFPGITKVINDVLYKGPEFDMHLMLTGLEGVESGKRAMESGSKLHKAFELAIYGNELSAVDSLLGNQSFTKKEWLKYLDWLAWYEALEITPLCVEKVLWSRKLKVACTVDLVAMVNGKMCILDWKTGNGIYDSGDVQAAGQLIMWNELAEEFNLPKCECAGVVHVGATVRTRDDDKFQNKGVKVVWANETDDKAIRNIIEIWHWRNPKPQIPTFSYPLSGKLSKGILAPRVQDAQKGEAGEGDFFNFG